MDIQHNTSGHKGSFSATISDQKAGEMFFTYANNDRIIIDHTEVENKFRGEGVGKKLLHKIVEFARKENLKVIPLCPFAKSVFDKEAELRDVL